MVKVKDLYEEPYALVGHVRICEGRKPKQRRNKMRKEKRKSLGAVTHTHTHTHTQDIYKRDRKQANTLVESVYSTGAPEGA